MKKRKSSDERKQMRGNKRKMFNDKKKVKLQKEMNSYVHFIDSPFTLANIAARCGTKLCTIYSSDTMLALLVMLLCKYY